MIPARRTFKLCVLAAAAILAAMAFHAWLASHDEQLRLQSTLATQKQQIDAADARERERTGTLNQTLAEIEKLKREVQTPQQILHDLPQYLKLPQPISLDSATDTEENPAVATPKENQKGTGRTSNSRGNDSRDDNSSASGRVPSGAVSNVKTSSLQTNTVDQHSVAAEGLPDAANQRTRISSIENQITTPSSFQLSPEFPPTADHIRSGIAGPDASSNSSASAEIPAADLKPLYDYVQDCRACQAQLAVAKQNRTDDASKLVVLARERDAAIAAAKGGTFWRRFRRNIEWYAAGAAAGAAAAVVATNAINAAAPYPRSHRR